MVPELGQPIGRLGMYRTPTGMVPAGMEPAEMESFATGTTPCAPGPSIDLPATLVPVPALATPRTEILLWTPGVRDEESDDMKWSSKLGTDGKGWGGSACKTLC